MKTRLLKLIKEFTKALEEADSDSERNEHQSDLADDIINLWRKL